MTDLFSTPTDTSRLRDAVVLVTGGASGLGRATCFALAEAGAAVVVADLNPDAGEAVAADVGGSFVRCDVSSLEDNEAMVSFALSEHGRLDHAFLNAGVTTGCGVAEDFDLAKYRRAMGANLDGVVFGTHAVLGALRSAGRGGSIVATASLAGLVGMPLDPLYSANKHAVVGFTRAMGPSYVGEGIRFNAVCPGFAESQIIADAREALVAAGFEIIPAENVAATVVRLMAGDMSGECWFIQPRREPGPFKFRNVPGPGDRATL